MTSHPGRRAPVPDPEQQKARRASVALRSVGPALVKGDWTAWWAYLAGPVAGAAIAVGFAYILRGRGGGRSGIAAADSRRGRNDPCPCGSQRKWKRCHGSPAAG